MHNSSNKKKPNIQTQVVKKYKDKIFFKIKLQYQFLVNFPSKKICRYFFMFGQEIYGNLMINLTKRRVT